MSKTEAQRIQIAQLGPKVGRGRTITFEVLEGLSRSADGKQVKCRVVDQSGVITACFAQYADLIKPGSVYDLHNFKCIVEDHHLQLTLTQDSVFSKQPLKMGFKDMENDLSAKFYAQAPVKSNKKEEAKEEAAEQKKETTQIKKEKPKYRPKVESNGQQKQQIQDMPSKKHEKQENKKGYPGDERQSRKKKQYRSKTGDGGILLADMNRHQESIVCLRVRVDPKSCIDKKKYRLVQVADGSGSGYVQMARDTELDEQAWYDLVDFVVYGDRKYGFVAVQEGESKVLSLGKMEDKDVKWRPIKF